MKSTLTRAALVAALGAALAGCSNPPMSGTVEHKQHSDAYTYVTHPCIGWTMDRYTSTDAKGRVSSYSSTRCIAWGTTVNHMPATWGICLKADPGDTEHDAEGCHDVSEATWHRYNEGDHYPDAR